MSARVARCLIVGLTLGVPSAAFAQSTGESSSAPQVPSSTQTAPRPAPKPVPASKPISPIAVRAMFVADSEGMSASQTFTAVTGSARVSDLGAGADVVFRGRPFVRIVFDHASLSGMRGVFDGTTFISNGISETITMTPIEIGGGWRFGPSPGRRARPAEPGRPAQPGHPAEAARPAIPARPPGKPQRLVPYVGGGVIALRYSEFSPVLDDTENTKTIFHGLMFFGGVDLRVGSLLSLGFEGVYRTIPNAIGASSSSVGTTTGETNLGGFVVRAMIGLRLGHF